MFLCSYLPPSLGCSVTQPLWRWVATALHVFPSQIIAAIFQVPCRLTLLRAASESPLCALHEGGHRCGEPLVVLPRGKVSLQSAHARLPKGWQGGPR